VSAGERRWGKEGRGGGARRGEGEEPFEGKCAFANLIREESKLTCKRAANDLRAVNDGYIRSRQPIANGQRLIVELQVLKNFYYGEGGARQDALLGCVVTYLRHCPCFTSS